MAGTGISITISAADRASAVFEKVNKSLTKTLAPMKERVNEVDASFGRLGSSIKEVSNTVGLTRVGAAMREAAKDIRGAATGASGLLTPLAALGSVATVGGAVAMARQFAEMGTDLSNTATRIGMPIQRLQVLQNTARMAGLSSEAMASSLGGLANAMNDARWGRNLPAATLARIYGMGDPGELSKKPEEAMLRLAGAAKRVNDAYGPQAAARLLNYFNVSQELLPLLVQGTDAMAQQEAAAAKLGAMTDAQAAASKRLTTAFEGINIAGENLEATIGEQLEPTLTSAIKSVEDWVSANGPEKTKEIGSWLKGYGSDIETVGGYIDQAVTNTIGWNRASEALATVIISQSVPGVARLSREIASLVGIRMPLWLLKVLGVEGVGTIGALGAAGWLAESERAAALDKAIPLAPGMTEEDRQRLVAGAVAGGVPVPEGTGQTDPISRWLHRVLPSLYPAPATKTFDPTLPPKMRGLLDTIAGGESGGDYSVLYGQRAGQGTITDFSQFPKWQGVQTGAGPTHAAGRYQFEPGTYGEAQRALDLPDFSPASQDRAASWLAQRDYNKRTGRDLLVDLDSSDPAVRASIAGALSPTWTSINNPGFVANLDYNTQREAALPSADVPILAPPMSAAGDGLAPAGQLSTGAAGAAGADGAPGPDGKVRHVIEFQNAPPGTTHRVEENTAGVDVQGPRVDLAMPMF